MFSFCTHCPKGASPKNSHGRGWATQAFFQNSNSVGQIARGRTEESLIMATAFSHVKEGVSVLMDTFKQFANKNIIECVKNGFPDAFLRCMNPQAAQSSVNDDVSKSEPGRN